MFNLGYVAWSVFLYAYYYKLVSQRSYTAQEIEQNLFLASLSSFFYYFTLLFVSISVLFYFKNKKEPIF